MAPRTPKGKAVPVDVPPPTIDSLLATKEIVVACGPGGVGKTTTAAASALMAAVTLGGGMWRPTGRVAALGVLLGDASYALYLTHPFVVAAAQRLGRVLHVAGGAGAWALFGGELALCAAVAILIHEKAERPLMRRLSEAARGRALAASVS